MAMSPQVVSLGPINVYFGTAVPSSGSGSNAWPHFNVGDIFIITAPSAGSPGFYMCSVASTPAAPSGTWVASANMV